MYLPESLELAPPAINRKPSIKTGLPCAVAVTVTVVTKATTPPTLAHPLELG